MSKITPQPSNYLFKQISIGPAPNILNEDKDTYTSFTTLDQLKRIDRKVKKGCMSITSDTDDTKSSVADEEIKESDLGVAYEDDPGEDDMECNDYNDYNDDNGDNDDNDDNDSKSTISETKSVKSVTKIGKEMVKKPRAKKQDNIELKKEEIDDSW